MNKGKTAILEYCGKFSVASIEHMEQAIENKKLIEKQKYSELNGCPSTFGLDDHIGLCEIEETSDYTYTQKCEMCVRCWKKALGV